MKLLHVLITLGESGFREEIKEIEVKETPKTYIAKYLRVDKSKHMTVGFGGYMSNTIPFNREAYCLPEQIEEARIMLKEALLERFKREYIKYANCLQSLSSLQIKI